jgi:hypothetical protein
LRCAKLRSRTTYLEIMTEHETIENEFFCQIQISLKFKKKNLKNFLYPLFVEGALLQDGSAHFKLTCCSLGTHTESMIARFL